MTDGRLQWHLGFSAALRVELEEDIIEYKSPEDYLSINDFYKVYGYTCFYQSETKRVREIPPEELTITFICNHYPQKLLEHLKKFKGIEAKKQEAGIYYLLGDSFPIQLVIVKELSKEENYWLQNLRCNLKTGEEIQEVVRRYEQVKHKAYYSEVMNLIVRANQKQMEEEKNMCEALNELFAEELKEADLRGRKEGHKEGLREGHKEGIEQGEKSGIKLAKRVFKLTAEGCSVENIAQECGISVEKVKEILE